MFDSIGGAWLLIAADDAQAAPASGGPSFLLTFVLPLMVIFYFLMIRPNQVERRRRQEMIRNVKENDRVVTIGGIYGVVTDVQREKDSVTLRVDEKTNTKIRVRVSAIGAVLGDETKKDESPSK